MLPGLGASAVPAAASPPGAFWSLKSSQSLGSFAHSKLELHSLSSEAAMSNKYGLQTVVFI